MSQQQEREENLLQPERLKQNPLQRDPNSNTAGQVKIDFYTDPLCCWSWAFDSPWREFLRNHSEVTFNYVLCGMIPDWNTYKDDMNSVSKPLQMGPVWMHASEVTNVPMKYSIWHEDPPASSFPSCIAVKTAGLQSRHAEDIYLLQLRKALMIEGKNIAKISVLLETARQLDGADFSFEKFKSDWDAGLGKIPFKSDLQKAKLNGIGRYPTLTFRKQSGEGIIIVGYRPYEVLLQAYELFSGSDAHIRP